MKNLLTKINNYNYWKRRLILIFMDLLIVLLSIIITSWIFNADKVDNHIYISKLFIINTLTFSLFTYTLTGQYKSLTKHVSSINLYKIFLRNLIIICELFIFCNFLNNQLFDIRFFFTFHLSLTINLFIVRIFIKDIIFYLEGSQNSQKINIAIYGAGKAGLILYNSLLKENIYRIVTFFDDSKELQGRLIDGVQIRSPNKIKKFKSKIEKILIAIPTIDMKSRKKLLTKLSNFDIPILEVPPIKDIVENKIKYDGLKTIDIADLLGREDIISKNNLITNEIKNRVICITGAGGTIGSSICNELFKYNPRKIVLIERNEFSLYKLLEKLNQELNIEIIGSLGDASDPVFIKNTFKDHNVEIIFHCAAYKHVPLVENNSLEGIKNNILCTLNLCKYANQKKVKYFVLISSDKAVRPTNIMGCSKRVCELIIKNYSLISENTIFGMVRFGNVLGSSGSVIPKFKDQIKKGGPITITDKRIVRYFMTIHEASELVIQSLALSTELGDLFLLDMGEEIKILNLAKNLIKLSGLRIKNSENPNGDIEIIETGLRPGEKLYEELLLDGKYVETDHPLIYKSLEETNINPNEFWINIKLLEKALVKYNKNDLFISLSKLVPEWKKYRKTTH